jgi:hypothetical protein
MCLQNNQIGSFSNNCIIILGVGGSQQIYDSIRPVSYVAQSSNFIQTNLIERIKCDGSALYETN